jgi:hypothetical protein
MSSEGCVGPCGRSIQPLCRSGPLRLSSPRRSIALEDALAILLALQDREPQTYSKGAARWGARFCLERRLLLPEAHLTLSALQVLPGPDARAGAEALIELANRHQLRRVDELSRKGPDLQSG